MPEHATRPTDDIRIDAHPEKLGYGTAHTCSDVNRTSGVEAVASSPGATVGTLATILSCAHDAPSSTVSVRTSLICAQSVNADATEIWVRPSTEKSCDEPSSKST